MSAPRARGLCLDVLEYTTLASGIGDLTTDELEMRAVVIDDNTRAVATSLSISEEAKPDLKDNKHVLVKVKAFGLNRVDINQRRGSYPVPEQASTILGVEFSGVIDEAGSDSGWHPGDEVFGLTYGGAYAEFVAVHGGTLIRKPESLSWAQAAALPAAWVTAFQALIQIAELKQGAKVLIHAGASSVGIAAIQLARAFGADEIFTTAGTKEKLDFLTSRISADHGINYKTQNFSEEIRTLTHGRGVDVILDFVGQEYFQMNLDSAAQDARIVILSLLSGSELKARTDMTAIFHKRLRIEGTTLRSRSVEYQKQLLQDFSRQALPKIVQGHYKLVIHAVMPWERIVEATQLLENAGNVGKVVCTI